MSNYLGARWMILPILMFQNSVPNLVSAANAETVSKCCIRHGWGGQGKWQCSVEWVIPDKNGQ